MGWTPREFWEESSFQDVCIAIDGYAVSQGATEKEISPPSKEFLEDMMEMYPDD